MIVNRAVADVAVTAGDTQAGWQCLIRRGMLHSECESVEYWRLRPDAVLPVHAEHGVEEAILVLDGAAVLRVDDGTALRAGRGAVLLVPHGTAGTVQAASSGARLVTVRVLAASVCRALPPRVPELVDQT
ncbi:cupin domain-containing protein [Micromonospora sp. WMMD712]|uniref:cupin domain-containing protein n=1 Tax=Micromonospora sp. WMMD712 TaxID=3016096 RepID=UPI00249B04EC|nr:cupin domain-containing protein [Micromonospora sp. WMMD712]WFE57282.1 cupin domain-containing protein [Micromonospora sp. WMMD712]